MPNLVLLAAIADNGVIGAGDELPWGRPIPRDIQNFRRITEQLGAVIMGRKTAESLGRPLPKRRNIVLTRNPDWSCEGFEVVKSLPELAKALGDHNAAVIGGAEIYRLLAPHCQRAVITRVHRTYHGDVGFPFSCLESYRPVRGEQGFGRDGDHPAITFYYAGNQMHFPLPTEETA